jgi:carbamate kinase
MLELLRDGHVVIGCGGGGIPVCRRGHALVGVEGVIDKDHSSALLAEQLSFPTLILLTSIDRVALHFRTRNERFLARMTADQAFSHLAEGHFPKGSMGPKVEAAARFVASSRGQALITDAVHLKAALAGDAGTWIHC